MISGVPGLLGEKDAVKFMSHDCTDQLMVAVLPAGRASDLLTNSPAEIFTLVPLIDVGEFEFHANV